MENVNQQHLVTDNGHMDAYTMFKGICLLLAVIPVYKVYQARERKIRRNKHLKAFDGPPGQWLLGHVNDMTMNDTYLTKMKTWASSYGGIFRLKIFGDDFVVLAQPELLAAVMKTTVPKDKLVYSFMSDYLGQSILISEGPHWFRNRRLLTPAFHFEVLKSYTEVFHGCVGTLLEKWKEMCNGKETSLEMFDHFSLLTLDSLLKTAFSTDSNCQRIGKKHPYIKSIYQIMQSIMDRITTIQLRNNFIFYNLTAQGRETKKALAVAKNFTSDIVKRRREDKRNSMTVKQGKYRDFVDMLLDAKDQDGCGLSDKEILDEVNTFMAAGHDTTASGLSWFMYNMARNPEHQERCREEINEVLAGRDNITWSDLPQFEYFTMCMKESLHVNAPVASVGRYFTEDFKIPDGRVIPAGTHVILAFDALHHDPEIWENPEEFDPSRFSTENTKTRHSHAFMPFSAGPRNCIGQHFAMNEMKIVAAQVLKNFHVDVDRNRIPKKVVSLVMRTEDGLWLKIRPI